MEAGEVGEKQIRVIMVDAYGNARGDIVKKRKKVRTNKREAGEERKREKREENPARNIRKERLLCEGSLVVQASVPSPEMGTENSSQLRV
jgi:hypothetical protein